jgi:hypothetical protein
MRVPGRRVTGKTLLVEAAAAVVLFVIALPFGTEKNHHSASYRIANIIFGLLLA